MARQMVAFNVRGKKGRRKPQAAADLAISTPGGRGRPMKTAKELKCTKRARKPPSSSTVSSVKIRSWLERLPAELTEQIFLHALEINMARASPLLGSILAKDSIYRVLILFAFFEEDEEYPVETKHFAPASYRLLNWEEKTRLQAGVLESRWCTFARIKQCFPILKRLVIAQQWHQDARKQALDQQYIHQPAAAASSSSSSLRPHKQHPLQLPDLTDHDALLDYYWNKDHTSCNNPSWEVNEVVDGWTAFNVRYFPDRLLDPPSWSGPNAHPETLAFLTQLHLSRTIWCRQESSRDRRRRDGTYSSALLNHDALSRGIQTAIREHARQPLLLLMRIYHTNYDASYHGATFNATTLRLEVTDERTDLKVENLLMKWLHLAVKQGRESSWIVRTLTQENMGYLTKDDEVLTKWALSAAEAGDEFAMECLLKGQHYG